MRKRRDDSPAAPRVWRQPGVGREIGGNQVVMRDAVATGADPVPHFAEQEQPTRWRLASWEISPVTKQPRCPNCLHPLWPSETRDGAATCEDCGAHLVAPKGDTCPS
ncbi:MAG TPA: hypothetical protein PKY30_09575 [Myxococcota bacterium]|nr:hypothetical protein [Myxococcota bacterium]HNH47276.1 hypothetical protein [Myxococcota bacterium]